MVTVRISYTFGMIAKRSTMTLNITAHEMEIMEKLAKKKHLSKTALVRQALRLYQILDENTEDGVEFYLKTPDNLKKDIQILL